MKFFSSIWMGILIGLIIPCIFGSICLEYLIPSDLSIIDKLMNLKNYPLLQSKFVVFSLLPNALAAFISYKMWQWRIYQGILLVTFFLLVPCLWYLA